MYMYLRKETRSWVKLLEINRFQSSFLPPAYSPALIYFGWERDVTLSDIMIFLFPTLFLMKYRL
jgi:hypothetical protein